MVIFPHKTTFNSSATSGIKRNNLKGIFMIDMILSLGKGITLFFSEQCRFKFACIFSPSYHNPHKLTEAPNKHM